MVKKRYFGAFLLGLSLFTTGPSVAAETKTPAPPKAVQQEKPKVLFLDLACTAVKPEVVETISDLVGAYLGEHKKYDVITGQDLRQMAKLEVEKQKTGCVDNSCLSQLAGAMGARYVVFGKVGKLADRTIITLNLFDSKEAKAVDRAVVSAPDIGSVPDLLPAAVAKLMGGQVVTSPVIKPVVVAPPSTPTPTVAPAPVAAPQAQPTAPIVPPTTPAPVAVEKVAVAEPAPPIVAPEPEGPKRQVPWLRVGSASALAAVGAGLALAFGQPAYSDMVRIEGQYISKAQDELENSGSREAVTESKANAREAQAIYLAGPVYWLWSGYSVALLAGSYALWAYITAPLITEENVEVTP